MEGIIRTQDTMATQDLMAATLATTVIQDILPTQGTAVITVILVHTLDTLPLTLATLHHTILILELILEPILELIQDIQEQGLTIPDTKQILDLLEDIIQLLITILIITVTTVLVLVVPLVPNKVAMTLSSKCLLWTKQNWVRIWATTF